MMTRKRKLIVVLFVAGMAALLLAYSLQDGHPQRGFAKTATQSPLGDLPTAATNIRWDFGGFLSPNLVYDFEVPESAFYAWVDDWSGVELNGPHFGPFYMLAVDPAGHPKYLELENTVSYTWSETDQGVYMVYDRDKKRAYFHTHGR